MRRFAVILGLLLLPIAVSGTHTIRQAPAPRPVEQDTDSRLQSLTNARVHWTSQGVQERAVSSLLVLVPDVETFLLAVRGWTPDCFYPILIEEPEDSIRFIRAFRPQTIIRLPAKNLDNPDRWQAACQAVYATCDLAPPPTRRFGQILVNPDISRRSPGLVLTHPESASLSGAVALAAGRFQSLASLESHASPKSILSKNEAVQAVNQISRIVNLIYSRFANLGDELDFLTLAVPFPDRYMNPEHSSSGLFALDDLIGRMPSDARRYAFVGRLLNSESKSVYQAMCSLFLQPDQAFLFDTYETQIRPWADYQMESSCRLLTPFCDVRLSEGPNEGTREAWYRAFDPVSKYGLVMVNSSGNPTSFSLKTGSAIVQDIPWSIPASVFYVHSYSAARHEDPDTVAGRWLANGAFLYFGSLEEPFLQSFRPPALVSQLLATGVPVSAALHKLPEEDSFGNPWRLHLIGDPLYRLKSRETRNDPRRPINTENLPGIPIQATNLGSPKAVATSLIEECWDSTLLELAARQKLPSDLAERLARVPAALLKGFERNVYQALLAELVVQETPETWKAQVNRIPEKDRDGSLRRALEFRLTRDRFLAK